MSTTKKGWALFLEPLPKEALKTIHVSVYRTSGLTDVNEGYLWERLHNSGLPFSLDEPNYNYLGTEDRKNADGTKMLKYYLASCSLVLSITDEAGNVRRFAGVSAHDNLRLDAAFKGAYTGAFKQCCKWAGMMMELYKGGKMVDEHIAHADDPEPAPSPNPNAHPVAQENAAAADAKVAETPKTDKKMSIDQQQTLLYLVETLPSSSKDDAPWTKTRLADTIKKYEARRAGDGFLGAFKTLEQTHGKECGTGCAHIELANASDGMMEFQKAANKAAAA